MTSVMLRGAALHGVDAPPTMLAGLPQRVALGRVRPKAVPPVLRLANYRRRGVALPRSSGDRRKKAGRSLAEMYQNHIKGCCVISGKYHSLGFWSAADNSREILVANAVIDQMYDRLKAGPGDSGCIITDVLDYFRGSGLPLGDGRVEKIDGYVSVDNTDPDEVKTALLLFGALTLGINLPDEWANAAVWDATNSPIVGGHDVSAVDYDDDGVYVSSWGRIYRVTWRAFTSRYWLEERYALLAPAWYGDDRLSPLGVKADELAADLAKLGRGELPPLPDPNPQPPAPPQPPVPPMPTSPTYAVSVSGRIPMLGNVTLTGTAVPKPAGQFLGECSDFAATPAGLGLFEMLRMLRQAAAFIAWLKEYLAAAEGTRAAMAAPALPAIPPAVIQLILDNVLKLLPVIVAGIQAGKSFADILQDCLKAILPQSPAAGPLPCVAGV